MFFEKPDLKSARPACACLFKIVLWGGMAGPVLLSILQNRAGFPCAIRRMIGTIVVAYIDGCIRQNPTHCGHHVADGVFFVVARDDNGNGRCGGHGRGFVRW